jgi:6-pyruvoyltetrahydropterin/6-carboxytetrahydropterin synthase
MKPSNIRITKQFHFESAHALWGYDGLCQNIHGHSYMLYVTLIGQPISNPESPKLGMVMDFSELKKIINELIIDEFDHALLLMKDTPLQQMKQLAACSKIVELDYQPTCENMLSDFAQRIITGLPQNVRLFSLRLHETATSYAEWFAADNV